MESSKPEDRTAGVAGDGMSADPAVVHLAAEVKRWLREQGFESRAAAGNG